MLAFPLALAALAAAPLCAATFPHPHAPHPRAQKRSDSSSDVIVALFEYSWVSLDLLSVGAKMVSSTRFAFFLDRTQLLRSVRSGSDHKASDTLRFASSSTLPTSADRSFDDSALNLALLQVSPPQESIKGDNWFHSYQPVSYIIASERGTREQFEAMVNTCAEAGVQIIVDAVLNHSELTLSTVRHKLHLIHDLQWLPRAPEPALAAA